MSLFEENVELARKEPFTIKMEVTPDIAAEMLARNADNRQLRTIKVSQLVSDITSGRFAFNGETIIISRDGELNDGQHRLAAIVQAGLPVVTNVTFGVERDTRMTVDSGAARTAGCVLGVQGVVQANIHAAAARLILTYERSSGKHLGSHARVSASAVIDRSLSDERVGVATKAAADVPNHVAPAAKSVMAFWHYLAGDKKANLHFWEAVAYGEGISRGDTAYLVRSRLMRDRITNAAATEIYLRGLAAYLRGDAIGHIRVLGDFPLFKD